MPLPRLHLFEFMDQPWAPGPLRATLVESLSRLLAWGRVLRGVAAPFARFMEDTSAAEVLELCAGGGSPATILAAELRAAGRTPPRFLLTDLQPHVAEWRALRAGDPDAIDYVESPVDATAIPPALGAGRAKLIINGLHHLPPDAAAGVLRGACADGPGVFVIEGFERNPLRFWPMAPAGLLGLFATPFLTRRDRLWKTLLLPLSLVAAVWDGTVSTLRVYDEAELRAMVAPLGDAFLWTYGTYSFPLGGKGYWFSGVRA